MFGDAVQADRTPRTEPEPLGDPTAPLPPETTVPHLSPPPLGSADFGETISQPEEPANIDPTSGPGGIGIPTQPLGVDSVENAPIPPRPAPDAFRSPALWDTIKSSGKLEPGQRIFGRYEVKRKLGGGGMGDVWLVRHIELNADRALKLILARIAYDTQARGRFRREAQIMARFSHPNAVTIHDARLTEQDVAYIEMEFVQGQSLDRQLKKGQPMPLDWVARILEQLGDVLQTAHEHQIVHRDLKPSNLMLLDGRPPGREFLKVLDFGISKILGADEPEDPDVHTMTGFFMGTPPYASPEQGDGKADHRSDLYAVGVILYELLTGFRPFTGNVAKLIADTLNATPPTFREANPNVQVPEAVEQVVLRCLAKDPNNRPQSARELVEAFQRALPVATLPPPPVVRPRSRPMLAAAGVVLALGVGITLAITQPWADRTTTIPAIALPSGFHAEKSAKPATDGFPQVIVSDKDRSRLIRIVGGSFTMEPEGAAREVTVPSFYMQETEVTNGQLKAYYTARQIEPPLPPTSGKPMATDPDWEKHPAVFVDHATATAYAHWLGGELPDAAEWEYAARSGGKPDYPFIWGAGPPLDPVDRRANVDSPEARTTTTIVKNFPQDRTEHGLFDMTGNVREWCRNPWDENEPGTAKTFEVRGGSWKTFHDEFRTTRGDREAGVERLNDLGFRVVVEWPRRETTASTP